MSSQPNSVEIAEPQWPLASGERDEASGGALLLREAEIDLDEELRVLAGGEREAKVGQLREAGREPYPHDFPGRSMIAELLRVHDPAILEQGEHHQLEYRIAGRMTACRGHGKTMFLDLEDRSGTIQIFARQDSMGEDAFARVHNLDVGDIVGVEGCIYATKRGQLALKVNACTLLAKALRPLPARHQGLRDLETRYRQRELDLMSNADTRRLFLLRSDTVCALRDWMNEHSFVEIETPLLQTRASGANARPFVTHHNALDRDLHLCISGEFYLKRAVVGGLERVYMLGKCFRNEGISHKHSPEFTLLEWEMAYADYTDVATYMQDMIVGVAERVLGTLQIEQYDGQTIDLTPPWRRVSVRDVLRECVGIDVDDASREQLVALLGEEVSDAVSWGQLVVALCSKLVEPRLMQPTIIYDYPIDFHPVVKRHRSDSRLIEHFEMLIRGIEVGSGSSELNDPIEQRRRFVEQRNRRPMDASEEPYPSDEDFVRAMEYGLPPLGGAGVGIDRLLAIFTGRESLREVIPFPLLRGKSTHPTVAVDL